MKPGASLGRIPAKVLVRLRASVTAGLAKEVDAVNQYADVIYAATASGVIDARERVQAMMTAMSPNVATNSLHHWAGPERTCSETSSSGTPNMPWAATTPATAPTTCMRI